MKTFGTMVMGLVMLFGSSVWAGETYKVDGVHSSLIFRIMHMGASYSYGRFNDISGSFVVDDDASRNSFQVEAKADSIDTHNEKRDAHLKSPDFFNAAQFPTLSFKSTSVSKDGDKTYVVTGELTIHGVTKPVTVKLDYVGTGKDPMGNVRRGYEGTFDIKRSDFEMTKMIPGAGDEVRIIVSLEGVKQ